MYRILYTLFAFSYFNTYSFFRAFLPRGVVEKRRGCGGSEGEEVGDKSEVGRSG